MTDLELRPAFMKQGLVSVTSAFHPKRNIQLLGHCEAVDLVGQWSDRWEMLVRPGPKLLFLAAITVMAPGSLAACSSSDARQPAHAEATLEQPDYVVDEAGVLSPAQRQKLTDQLGRFERETRHQFVVVTVKSLGGVEVAAFTRTLANKWGVGRKGINDGIVLLVAPNERKARIAIGYGLERQLPDAFCQEVMARQMIPAFAQGQFDDGLEAGVTAIIKRLAATSGDTR